MNVLSSITLLFALAISMQGACPYAFEPQGGSCEGQVQELKGEAATLKRKADSTWRYTENLIYENSDSAEYNYLFEQQRNNQRKEILQLQEENARLREQLNKGEECEDKPGKQLSGWFTAKNGYEYTVTNKMVSFDESEKSCESMGGKLASKGMRDLDLRRGILDGFKPKGAWIGLRAAEGSTDFKWNDGVAGTKENIHWAADQPNGNGKESCGQIAQKKKYRTNDFVCERKLSAVCEREAPAEGSP